MSNPSGASGEWPAETRRLEGTRVEGVGEAARAAMLGMGMPADKVERVIAEYKAEQLYETGPPPPGPRMLGREMNMRLANPALDRFLGRPDNADDLEDEFGRSLLL